MRVGLVVYGGLDGTSGGFRYDRRVVDALRDAGDEVEVVALPWRTYPRHLADNLRVDLADRLDGVDVLLQDELCHPSLLLPNRRLDAELPVVSVVHHLRSAEARPAWRNRLYRTVEARYLRSVDGAVCNSAATRASVARLCEAPSVVAPPAADHFSLAVTPADVRERAGRDPFGLVFLGSVVPRKGLATLVDALDRLPDGEWTLTVVGRLDADPGYVETVRRRVRDRGLDDAVTFAGEVADGEVADRLARSHLLAVPSTHEGFGMAYLEGMGFGLPALATTAGGASEVVTHGETGYLVSPDDPEAIAELVGGLLADRDALADLGVAALERFEAQPGWAETTGRIREFLVEMVEDA